MDSGGHPMTAGWLGRWQLCLQTQDSILYCWPLRAKAQTNSDSNDRLNISRQIRAWYYVYKHKAHSYSHPRAYSTILYVSEIPKQLVYLTNAGRRAFGNQTNIICAARIADACETRARPTPVEPGGTTIVIWNIAPVFHRVIHGELGGAINSSSS
jgi:hypothetical protein